MTSEQAMPIEHEINAKRILVVEDIDNARAMYVRELRREGFVVDEARNLDSALQLLQERTYHVALVDIMLGGEHDTANRDGLVVLSTDSSHAAWPTPKTSVDTGEALGERVHQEGANHVNKDCHESFEPEHASMMSLSGSNVKPGKCGYPASWGEVARFSRLVRFRAPGKVD